MADVVDAHIHVLDATWIPEGMRRAWARQASTRRLPARDPDELYPKVSLGQSDPEAELTIAAFDRAGVSTAVIPVVDWTIVGAPAGQHLPIRDLNRRHVALAERYPGRFVHCAGVDPRHADARDIAVEALDAEPCRGLKLYPAAGWVADDPAHAWVWDLLVERGDVAVVHTSPLGGDPLVTPRSRPAALAPVLAAHPDLTLVFAHAGHEAWWAEALDIASGWRSTHLEVSLWQNTADRDYAEFRARMARVVSVLGAHRVLFGSDIIRGPQSDPDGDDLIRWIDQFRGLAEPFEGAPPVVGGEQLDLMLAGNARRVYRLPKE